MSIALLLMLIKEIWDKFAYWIMLIGGAFVAVMYVFFKGKAAGKKAFVEHHKKLDDKAVKNTAKIKQRISKASDDEIQRKLEKYYRD